MSYPLGGIIVDPGGYTAVTLTFTDANGNAPSVFSDPFGINPVTLPYTLSSQKTFFMAKAAYTVSGIVNGAEMLGVTLTAGVFEHPTAWIGPGFPPQYGLTNRTVMPGNAILAAANIPNPLTTTLYDTGGAQFNIRAYGAKADAQMVSAGGSTTFAFGGGTIAVTGNNATNGISVTAGSTTATCSLFTTPGTYLINIWGAGQITKSITNVTNVSTLISCTVANTLNMYGAFGQTTDQWGTNPAQYGVLSGPIVSNGGSTITANQIISVISNGTPSTLFKFVNADSGGTYGTTGTWTAPYMLNTTLTVTKQSAKVNQGTLGVAASYTVTNGAGSWGTDDYAAWNSAIAACQTATGGVVYTPNYSMVHDAIVVPYNTQAPVVVRGPGKRAGGILMSNAAAAKATLAMQTNGAVETMTLDAQLGIKGGVGGTTDYTSPGGSVTAGASTVNYTNLTQVMTVTYTGAPTSLTVTDTAGNVSGSITWSATAATLQTNFNNALAAATPAAINATAAISASSSSPVTITLTSGAGQVPFLASAQFTGGTAPVASFNQKTITLASSKSLTAGWPVSLGKAGTSLTGGDQPPFVSTVAVTSNNSTTLVINDNPLTSGSANGMSYGSARQPISEISFRELLVKGQQYSSQVFAMNFTDSGNSAGNPFTDLNHASIDGISFEGNYGINQELINVTGIHVFTRGSVHTPALAGRAQWDLYSFDIAQSTGTSMIEVVAGNIISLINYSQDAGGASYVIDNGVTITDPGNNATGQTKLGGAIMNLSDYQLLTTAACQVNGLANGQVLNIANSTINGGIQPQNPGGTINLTNCTIGNNGTAVFSCAWSATGTTTINITGGSINASSVPVVHANSNNNTTVNLTISPSTKIIGTPSSLLDHGTLVWGGDLDPATFNIPGAVTASTLGPFQVSLGSGRASNVYRVVYGLATGTATLAVQRAAATTGVPSFSSISGLSSLSATTSNTTTTSTFALTDGDLIQVVVSSPASSPTGLWCSVVRTI